MRVIYGPRQCGKTTAIVAKYREARTTGPTVLWTFRPQRARELIEQFNMSPEEAEGVRVIGQPLPLALHQRARRIVMLVDDVDAVLSNLIGQVPDYVTMSVTGAEMLFRRARGGQSDE